MPFIPKINQPLEGVPHARWLEKFKLEQDKLNAEFRKFMEQYAKQNATSARQSSAVNSIATNTATRMSGVRGLPDGDADALVLRTTGTASPFWSGETLDQMVTYYVMLGDGAYNVQVYAGESNTRVPFPLPVFVDDFTLGELSTTDQRPVNLELQVFPSSELEEFDVTFPSYNNPNGNSAAFWSLHLLNPSPDYSARVNISGSGLMYAGTNIPVMGDLGVWDLPPEFDGVWSIQHCFGTEGVNAATPLSAPDNTPFGTDTNMVMDKWYSENVGGRAHQFPFDKSGTVTVAPLTQTYYNDTASTQYITKARATVGTAPTGADIEIDILIDGVSVITTPLTIAATTTTGTLTPDARAWPVNFDVDFYAIDWPVGSRLTVAVTQVGSTIAGSDLTVQVWAG